MDSDSDLITQLRRMLADAEAREDPVDAAWARYALARAEQVSAQLDAVESLLLALIPTRERGALTALVVAEAMPRITAVVGVAVAEAKAVADDMTGEADERG